MNQRPTEGEFADFHQKYVRLVPDGSVLDHLAEQMDKTISSLSSMTETQAGGRYADGKWSLKEVLGHIVDNERIMGYRLLRIARGDQTPLPGYDQDRFVQEAMFDHSFMTEIIEDYAAVRRSTLTLLRGLPEHAWVRTGTASNYSLSVRALAFIIAGHELHHLNVIQEKYMA